MDGEGKGQMVDEEFVDLILQERTRMPVDIWKPVFNNFLADLDRFVQPLGHGTASAHVESILQHGLGARKPATVFSPHLNSMCDLKKPDGLMACYAFATWNKTDNLAIDSRQITGKDVVDRYAEVNPFVGSWLKKFILRRIAKKYIKIRGIQQGYAVLLVYDGGGSATCDYRNSAVPSEVDCKTILGVERLKYVFVPATCVKNINDILRRYEFLGKILPLELFELQEIERHTNSHFH